MVDLRCQDEYWIWWDSYVSTCFVGTAGCMRWSLFGQYWTGCFLGLDSPWFPTMSRLYVKWDYYFPLFYIHLTFSHDVWLLHRQKQTQDLLWLKKSCKTRPWRDALPNKIGILPPLLVYVLVYTVVLAPLCLPSNLVTRRELESLRSSSSMRSIRALVGLPRPREKAQAIQGPGLKGL